MRVVVLEGTSVRPILATVKGSAFLGAAACGTEDARHGARGGDGADGGMQEHGASLGTPGAS